MKETTLLKDVWGFCCLCLNIFVINKGCKDPYFVDLLEDAGSKIAPKFKDSKTTNVTNHTLKKQQKQGFKLFYHQSIQTNHLLSLLFNKAA